jgi:uncharacterized protein (TIGR00297 family)
MKIGMTFQSWQTAVPQFVAAIGLSAALAVMAWGLRVVTIGAAGMGVLLTIVLCLAAGPAALLPIFVVFLLTWGSTRVGRRKKERLGLAGNPTERRRGRNALQILANVGVTAICAAPLIFVEHARFLLLAGASAALAEAAGDTVGSELGQAFGGSPRLITTWRKVAPGQDGGITIAGTLLSFCAALLVCSACVWAGLLLSQFYWTVLAAAFFGTIVDSLLGATLERRGLIGNDAVNFSSTAFSAALAITVLFFQHST